MGKDLCLTLLSQNGENGEYHVRRQGNNCEE